MTVTVYVGNLPWAVTEDELARAFRGVAKVEGVRIITERGTGRSRGFGFVEVEGLGLEEAVRAMDGVELEGRRLTVRGARPRPERD